MAAPQQSNQPDNSAAIIWIVAACLIFGVALWYYFKKQIITVYFLIKLYEINFLSYFTDKLADVRTVILTSDPDKVSFDNVVSIGQAVGDYLRYPLVFIIFILAFAVFFGSSTRVYKKVYSMRDLVDAEKENWPQIMPASRLNLVKMDIDKGPWAMAMTPMQFCKRNRLLVENRKVAEGLRDRNKIEVTLKRGEANKLFAIQLGALWPGINNVPPHVKALFAAFAARINGDGKGAADLFRNINLSSAKKLDFTGADELCKKHEGTAEVQRIVQNHAYLLTLMASMLQGARRDGVQGSADFLWLKPVDRKLWYMLNTVGRQTPFVEVAGPFSHWMAEREIARKLVVPMVEEATNALEVALKEIVYRPDESQTEV